MMFRPAARFLIAPRPPDFLAARFLAAVILPPLLLFAILQSPPSKTIPTRYVRAGRDGRLFTLLQPPQATVHSQKRPCKCTQENRHMSWRSLIFSSQAYAARSAISNPAQA